MFQNLRPTLCHRATAAGVPSEIGFLLGCGTAAGLRAAPAIPNGRSPRTGLAYPAAAQSRAAGTGKFSSKSTRGIQS